MSPQPRKRGFRFDPFVLLIILIIILVVLALVGWTLVQHFGWVHP